MGSFTYFEILYILETINFFNIADNIKDFTHSIVIIIYEAVVEIYLIYI
jgi:hypothetical protein